jgi:hypothetical protein
MKAFIIFGMLCISTSLAPAGEIWGTITDSGKPVPAGVKVEVAAGGNQYSGETDKSGTYHIFVNEKGKVALTVNYKDQKPAADGVFSFDKATRYDWNIEVVDGKMMIKRK